MRGLVIKKCIRASSSIKSNHRFYDLDGEKNRQLTNNSDNMDDWLWLQQIHTHIAYRYKTPPHTCLNTHHFQSCFFSVQLKISYFDFIWMCLFFFSIANCHINLLIGFNMNKFKNEKKIENGLLDCFDWCG